MILRCLVLAAGVAAMPLTTTAATTAALPGSDAVLYQSFDWHSADGGFYRRLAVQAPRIRALGATQVWLPPPSDAASKEGYLPRRLQRLDSAYGTEAELRTALSALQAQGLGRVADVVVNHRVGTRDWGDFTEPAWGCEAAVSGDEWPGACGGVDSGHGYGAARDLDHAQPRVQADLSSWLATRLQGVGFSGIRFDYAKGYAPAYAAKYHDAMVPDFCVGEIWTDLDLDHIDDHRQQLMDYVDGTGGRCAAFDFTTKGLLNDALARDDFSRLRDARGLPAGGIGWWPARMVTFVDNHDTGPSGSLCSTGQNHWPTPCRRVLDAYAYVLSHPGVPSVYGMHLQGLGLARPVARLLALRREQGLHAESMVQILRAEPGLYAAVVDDKLTVRLGTAAWAPGPGWRLRLSGARWAIWTRP